MKRYLHLVVALLFALFAYWQLNDPDSWAWIAMYLSVAVVAGLAAFGRSSRPLIYIALAAAGIWLVFLIPDFIDWVQMGMPTITGSMKAEAPHIELTREFLGLAICSGTLLVYLRRTN
jgi:hypothetical protein